MRIVADTHLHLYPCYDVKKVLVCLRSNLASVAKDTLCMAFLAERWDCHFFQKFCDEGSELLDDTVQITCSENVLVLSEAGFPDLYIFAGRQIITRERIEILSLTTDEVIPDGLPARDVISKIQQVKGVPVLSWAPGKWFFKRKKVVEKLLDTSPPGSLLIGDTTLRPFIWPQPLLMRKARRKGFGVVAGSDPLPFAGEEQVAGQYATQMEIDFDLDDPVNSIRNFLTSSGFRPTLVGRRGGTLPTFRRLVRNARSKKR